MVTRSWAPGHATLFFAVPKKYNNPEKMGSIGAGLNFESGVTTSISESNTTKILWNNEEINGNVTKTVIDLFQKIHDMKFELNINHESKLKTGYGLSTSGAGAIGTALALNSLFQKNMDYIDLFELAHKAELINHTGLGSVVGQFTGGIEVRISQGGPKLSRTVSFNSSEEIVIGFLGPLSTKDVLTSSEQMDLVTKSGIRCVEEVKKITNPSITQIIKLGREFMETCGLMTSRIESIISQLDNIGEKHSTMAMIGEAIIIKPINKDHVLKMLNENNIECFKTVISSKSPYVLD
ncbi:MAG: hypothetical protein GPJ54_13200 [Candidatus Heimdallarchaeota archaeon]|nr:hypothetical protein [Candidatus Heimdallarchaeota archaeon]